MTVELIIGGARSGKSSLAERRAKDSGLEVSYIATATAGDQEMRDRIAHHRQRRPGHWRTVEEPLQLSATLRAEAAAERCLLVDCVTLWLTNLLLGPGFEPERSLFLEALPTLPGRVILVSNEVGWGLVPMNELGRRFADEQGRTNQEIAAACNRVTLVVAGQALELKS